MAEISALDQVNSVLLACPKGRWMGMNGRCIRIAVSAVQNMILDVMNIPTATVTATPADNH